MLLYIGCRGVANGANDNKTRQTTDMKEVPLDFGETIRVKV